MNVFKVKPGLSEAIICSLALIIFSLFIRSGLPLKIISFLVLAVPSYFIGRASLTDLRIITGYVTGFKSYLTYSIIAVSLGLIVALLYRWHANMTPFPYSFGPFLFTAALIGCTEELIFRGYLQGRVSEYGPVFSVLFSSAAHTGYKCSLFILPIGNSAIDIGFLAFWTFLIGSVYGVIRHLSGSVVPSLISHALFDILVYGGLISSPWWVW